MCYKVVEITEHYEENDDFPHHDLQSNTWVTGKTVMRWFYSFCQKTTHSSIIHTVLQS